MVSRTMTKRRITLYGLAAVVGLISGLSAVALRYAILAFSIVFILIPEALGPLGWLIAPSVGGLLVGILIIKWAPESKGHGVPEIMEAYALEEGKMPYQTPVSKLVTSALCIGSGGCAGKEGPIAQIGGGVGSAVAQYLHLNPRMTKTLVVCGVSGGLAATFNSPLGGFLFGVEIIAGGIVGFSVIPVILSSVIAVAVSNALLGTTPAYVSPTFTFTYPELILYLALGLILGLVSVAWNKGFFAIESLLEKLRVSHYALPAIGGFFVGGLAILTLMLEAQFGYHGVVSANEPVFPAILGDEYSFIDTALGGLTVMGALFAFGVLKMIGTSLTLGSGGSGGVMAPTLYIGTALGGTVGYAFSILFPTVVTQPMAFALVGMAALFGASGRAPITIIVMVTEMTRDYGMMLPLMIAVSTSFMISSVIEADGIYTFKLVRRGVNLRERRYLIALREVKAYQVMTAKPTILTPGMTVEEVLTIVDSTHHTKFPVVDENGHITGILLTEGLFHEVAKECGPVCVEDHLSRDYLRIAPNCTMDTVVHEMLKRDEGHAVVVNPSNPDVMVGFITKADVLRAYEYEMARLFDDGEIVELGSVEDLIDIK